MGRRAQAQRAAVPCLWPALYLIHTNKVSNPIGMRVCGGFLGGKTMSFKEWVSARISDISGELAALSPKDKRGGTGSRLRSDILFHEAAAAVFQDFEDEAAFDARASNAKSTG